MRTNQEHLLPMIYPEQLLSRRSKRRKVPWISLSERQRRMAQLEEARDALISIRTNVIINSELYDAAGRALDALDEIEHEITGEERRLFS